VVAVGRYDELPAAARRRLFFRALVRPSLSTTGLLLTYYLLPVGDGAPRMTAAALLVALVIVVAVLTWQVQTIRTSTYPRLRAIETTAFSLPLFILLFAAAYFATSSTSPASFSEGLDRTDALYFAVTVFATVGFGDITPVTEGARVLVTIQMIGDLLLIGVVARVILGAVRSGLRRQGSGAQPEDETVSPDHR
jgi:voltage-gated potassium channel